MEVISTTESAISALNRIANSLDKPFYINFIQIVVSTAFGGIVTLYINTLSQRKNKEISIITSILDDINNKMKLLKDTIDNFEIGLSFSILNHDEIIKSLNNISTLTNDLWTSIEKSKDFTYNVLNPKVASYSVQIHGEYILRFLEFKGRLGEGASFRSNLSQDNVLQDIRVIQNMSNDMYNIFIESYIKYVNPKMFGKFRKRIGVLKFDIKKIIGESKFKKSK